MANINLGIAAEFYVAEKLLEALEQQNFEIESVTAIELEKFNEEQALRFNHKSIEQLTPEDVDWAQFSHVLFAGKMNNAEQLAAAVQAGCIVIDLFGLCALINDVPVIVPSVNDYAIANIRERNIISLANPQISQLALALKPLADQPIQHIFVSSMLPASYFGEEKVRQLAGQTAQLLNGIPLDDENARVAFDTVPSNVQDNEKSLPFSKVIEPQLAKILPNLTASTTFHSIQTPVFYGLSQMVSVKSAYPLDSVQLSEQWQQQSWLTFNEDTVITPVKNGENEETNALQISQLLAKDDTTIQFWSVCDEQKFSIAFLGIQLLILVLEMSY